MKQKLLSITLYIISLLPFWILYRFSDLAYLLLYYVIGYRKNVVYENLRNSFPEKSASEIKSIAKKFYRYFPDILIEAIKMKSMSAAQVKKRMELIDEDEIYRHLEKNKGVIGVTAHYGNWELGIHRLSLMTDAPVLIIYKPLNNKVVNNVFNELRSRFGALMIPMKQILRHVIRLKGKPHISMFVADQTPIYQDSDYFLNFLNQDTLVYTGTERIARLTKDPIVYCHIGRKQKRGHYFCKFTTLVEDPDVYEEHEITKLHNKFTEDIIRETPEYWLWSHKRWKRKRRK
ncbi:lysophospholipid acyltransferase family protein [Sphingobacterium sp. UT-1RO-CII-1]|uniref:lysophospholipid acyltransferase family protein n=1 Tax=Sphingobacterium sp. UT-1RO-CII-1 TaxID=2995225 RepID=UPI00227D5C52|nr:lysophospholipid acyltransferase family protein [Sphingobacterium sp. UT-1RO-CII-1]MCY4780483.1 lysophospholipid acyltransferase family protein [Sphingobacterium sp. UT-1RO-CII-1]